MLSQLIGTKAQYTEILTLEPRFSNGTIDQVPIDRVPTERFSIDRVSELTDGASGAGNPASQADPDIPQEYHKTFLAFLFIFGAWVATTTSLALTHERVPDVDPLPDVFLDNVHYQPWGLDASEIIIMVATLIAATLVVIHKHR